MLTQEDMHLLEALFDKKLEPINNSLDSIETNMAEMKESLAEVREAANYLLDLVDGKEKAIRKLPSINKGRHGFDGQKCPPYCVKPLENTAVFPAGLSLSGHISAPAKLQSTCQR